MNCEKEMLPMPRLDRSGIVRRIDMITRELAELRQMVEHASPTEESSSLTSELLGCLGSEPIDDYDYAGDWARFGADDHLT